MAAEEAMKALQEEAANSADDQVGHGPTGYSVGRFGVSLSPSEFSDLLLVPPRLISLSLEVRTRNHWMSLRHPTRSGGLVSS